MTEFTVSTVVTGTGGYSMGPNCSVRPYYCSSNSYYYVFYFDTNGPGIYYKKSSDGESWDSQVQIVSGDQEGMGVFCYDDKILASWKPLIGTENHYSKIKVGTFQVGGTINWGSTDDYGSSDQYPARAHNWCYHNGTNRVWFQRVSPGTSDTILRSENDGSSWSNLGSCDTNAGYYFSQYPFAAYEDGDKIQTLFCDGLFDLDSRERNGASCGTLNSLDTDFIREFYPQSMGKIIFDGTYMHVVYIDSSGNLEHEMKEYGDGDFTKQTQIDTVSTTEGNNAIGLITENGNVHLLYTDDDTTLYYRVYDGSWSDSETLFTDEVAINYLCCYPYALATGEIISIFHQYSEPNYTLKCVLLSPEQPYEDFLWEFKLNIG